MGRLSLSLTAKMVCPIMDRSSPWAMDRAFPPLTEGSSGKSSSLLPLISKEVGPHWMWTDRSAPADRDTASSGIRRRISPSRRADSTMAPGSVTPASTWVTIPVSRL